MNTDAKILNETLTSGIQQYIKRALGFWEDRVGSARNLVFFPGQLYWQNLLDIAMLELWSLFRLETSRRRLEREIAVNFGQFQQLLPIPHPQL